jgi:hypothetical protein
MIVEGPQGPQGPKVPEINKGPQSNIRVVPQGPKVPEINKGPQSNMHYQDGPKQNQLRPSEIRSVEQSSQSVASKARAAEFARNFKTGEQPKIGSGYDPSGAIRDTEQTLRGQREAQRNTAARTNSLFYKGRDDLPIRTQEQILRDSGYPDKNIMPPNFWGLSIPHP